jgi:protein-S-isoprenylcysteine O-methyltransferase Ste14
MNNNTIIRILLAAFLFTGISISATFRHKADKESGEKVSVKDEGKPMLFAYVINPAWMAWSKVGLPDWTRWIGVGVGIICVGLICWLFSSIGRGITPTVATRAKHTLAKHGPYRWVRLPLYTVVTTFFLSFGVVADNWFILSAAIIAFFLLAMRTPNEEAHLIEKFGDEYCNYRG